MINVCKVCNKEFESKRKKEYCSEKCYSRFKYFNNTKYKLTCDYCNKIFYSYRKDIKCCSKSCATKKQRKSKNITIYDIEDIVINNNQIPIQELANILNISVRKIYLILKENGFNSYKEYIGIVKGIYLEKNRVDVSISSLNCFNLIEEILKEQYILEKEFDDLINPKTGRKLRIDCFFQKHNIAIEYNGIQHYKHIPYFHTKTNTLAYQKYKDKIKYNYCKNHNIKLIIISYKDNLTLDNLNKILAEATSNQVQV